MNTQFLKDPAEYAAQLLDAGVPVGEIYQSVNRFPGASYDYAKKVELAARQVAISRLQVGDGVALYSYSDVEPATIIARTAKTMTVQHDVATQLHQMADLDPHPGGFACHFANQSAQRWDIKPDPDGAEIVITRRKNGWGQKGSSTPNAGAGRRYFHDYNF